MAHGFSVYIQFGMISMSSHSVMHDWDPPDPLEAGVIRFGRDSNELKTACLPVGDSAPTNLTLLAVG